jgi:general secretion pathway protein M
MIEQLRDWLTELSARERNLVYAAAALLGVLLLYLILILPFQTTGTRMDKRVDQKAANLAWMRAKAPEIQAAAGSASSPNSGESLVVLIDRTAREAGLATALRDQSPNGEHGLRIRLEAASFDTLMVWLTNLQQQYGVGIESATVEAAAPGLVNATLTLTQPSAPG